MSDNAGHDPDLKPLAEHLRARRGSLLEQWRAGIEQDPALPDSSEWTQAQFLDHFPEVLDGVERIFSAWPDPVPGLWRNQAEKAQSHARYRWLQGYTLRTVALEWGSLNRRVLDEIADFYGRTGSRSPALKEALRLWASVLEQHLTESVIGFHHLSQAEAATRAQELGDALHRLRDLNSERSQAVSAAAREIRERLSVAQTSASVMGDESVSVAERHELREMVTRSLQMVGSTLSNVSTLAQLEAGAEHLNVAAIDAGQVMELACLDLQAQLEAQDLRFVPEGPASLPVEGDALRIALLLRHLVLTACSAARHGTMVVKWGADQRTAGRWFLNLAHSVRPGGSRNTSPTALALSEATREAHRTERGPKNPIHGESRGSAPVSPMGSDGVHLAIAKRLCELLHASLEMETTEDGLQYRVTLPQAYAGEEIPR